MNKYKNQIKSVDETKKTILPFVVHRAPVENHIAYEKKGHWTQKEKLKYVIFLSYFKEKFTAKDKKKRFCRVFKVMSDFIKTRTHNQCRSHHQKMEKQRFQVDSIIKNVVSKYHPRVYQELYERYIIEIENLNIDDQEEYKVRKMNQNELKQSCQPNEDIYINSSRKNKRENQREDNNKRINEMIPPVVQTKLQENSEYLQHEPWLKKKELKMTQDCQEDSFDCQIAANNMCLGYQPQNWYLAEKQKSLDFTTNTNLLSLKYNQQSQNQMTCFDYLQTLETRKIDCYSKIVYHYNQMQLQLNCVAEYQREKNLIIQRNEEKLKQEKSHYFNKSHSVWEFNHYK